MSFPEAIQTSVVVAADQEGPGENHGDLESWHLGHARNPLHGRGECRGTPKQWLLKLTRSRANLYKNKPFTTFYT